MTYIRYIYSRATKKEKEEKKQQQLLMDCSADYVSFERAIYQFHLSYKKKKIAFDFVALAVIIDYFWQFLFSGNVNKFDKHDYMRQSVFHPDIPSINNFPTISHN